ncbi:hypothetical protein GCM10027059_26230 [Myceligenerans halotolerans]
MASFNPGDRVQVVAGPHTGRTGAVVDLGLGRIRVNLDGTPVDDWNAYYPDELALDLAIEGAEALGQGRPLPRRTPRVTLGRFWAAQAAARRSPFDAPIPYVPVQGPASSDGVTLSFGGVA